MITPSSNIPDGWIKFSNLFPSCMILDFNNLLGDYYFQNLALSCQTLRETSLCHIFHMSLPPWLLRKSHINSTRIPQTLSLLVVISCHSATPFPTIAEAEVKAFRSLWIQSTGMQEYQGSTRGGGGDSKLASISVFQHAQDSQTKNEPDLHHISVMW